MFFISISTIESSNNGTISHSKAPISKENLYDLLPILLNGMGTYTLIIRCDNKNGTYPIPPKEINMSHGSLRFDEPITASDIISESKKRTENNTSKDGGKSRVRKAKPKQRSESREGSEAIIPGCELQSKEDG